MFKILMTLARGSAARAEEDMADRHALLILDQQIREAAAGIDRSRKSLAVAIAQDATEAKRLAEIEANLAELEDRAVAALNGGREDLAGEAAEAIAGLEADRDAVRSSRADFLSEIAKLRTAAADAGRRLGELERGRRVAEAS